MNRKAEKSVRNIGSIHILLVEDSTLDAELIESDLFRDYRYKYEVSRVDQLEKGIKLLSENDFEIALLDLNLPDSSGLETFNRFIKAAPYLPVIVLTGYQEEGIAAQILQKGSQDYIIKGENTGPQLLKAIRCAMERQQFTRQLAEREAHIGRLNRVYALLSESNQAIVRIREPAVLYEKLCRIGIETGGFHIVWIGQLEETSQQLRVVAHSGGNKKHFKQVNAHLHQELIMETGVQSSASFTIRVSGKIWGTINFYADKPNFFNEDEAMILNELASDLSFAIEFAEHEVLRMQAEEEIKSIARFPSENPFPVIRFNREGKILYANKASDEVLNNSGCSDNQMAPTEWLDLIAHALKMNEVKEIEVDCNAKIYSLCFTPIAGSNYINVYGNDITARKNTEKILKMTILESKQYNNLMVGRELKMIELKNEINQLRIKLGLGEKYKIVEQ